MFHLYSELDYFTLQLIPRNRTPQEILEEYENLQKEREERRMQQSTNPRVRQGFCKVLKIS